MQSLSISLQGEAVERMKAMMDNSCASRVHSVQKIEIKDGVSSRLLYLKQDEGSLNPFKYGHTRESTADEKLNRRVLFENF